MSRIIAGSRGGRRLSMPGGQATRPTSDRVREALFSAITSWTRRSSEPVETTLAGRSFCDLYSGSGAVGLEAASRGAAPVLLVESSRLTAAVAGRNIAAVDLEVELRVGRVEHLVRRRAPTAYDVVFADPPYALPAETLDGVVDDLLTHGWVSSGGLLVLERSARSAAPRWPDEFSETWRRDYGETVLHFAAR